ncbi:MFS transporter [uncultured Bacteroides sp.]|uniref:MFS transporter n=1 Tax=uncultured Bacteroides sp. TaxID=162156 RepID=UPI002AAA8661|nr:MFS transporter [uncultured Bacteroides sp.]
MRNKLMNEYRVFRSYPHNMRTLLITNMVYALVLPIVEIFVGAYVMRSTNSPAYVALYQLAMYCGIVCTSVINGFLLKYFRVNYLYSLGMLLSGLSMVGMMVAPQLGIVELGIAGFVLGAASGFFWTNRYLLALNSTTDNNRNYFFGLESFAFTIASIVVPFCVGALIATITGKEILGCDINLNKAYRIVTIIATGVCILACVILARGNFENPVQKRFFFSHFHHLWYKQLLLACLKGLVQGFLVTAPAILVLKFIGNEGALGVIQSISGGLTAILIYILGRATKPRHRIYVFGTGMIIFLIGTLFNGTLFSAAGVIIFVLCKVIFQPLHDLAYFPIMMKVIDVVSKIEKRNKYAYILSHEFGLFLGRASGLTIFIFLAFYVSEDFSLKYALIIVALLQMLSIPLSKHIIRQSTMLDDSVN